MAWGGVGPQPLFEHGLGEGLGFEVVIDEGDDISVLGHNLHPVEAEKHFDAGKANALVAIDETMVHRQTLPERGGLLNQIGIIAGLGHSKAGSTSPLSRTPGVPPKARISSA